MPDEVKRSRINYNLNKGIPDETIDESGKLNYLNRGEHGIVTTPEDYPDRVVKYSEDPSELQAAQIIWDYQQKIGGFSPYATGVYKFEKVKNSDNVYRIEMEKVAEAYNAKNTKNWNIFFKGIVRRNRKKQKKKRNK